MLLERSQAGSAVCVSKMAAKADSDEEEIHTTADDELDAASELKTDIQTPTRRKTSEAFEVDFGEPMPEKPTNNLQEAFKKFKKQRQDDIKQTKRMLRHQRRARRDPQRMEKLRHKFMEQTKRYFGVPYARKYWAKDTPEYKSPLFLDCCGLVRQVMRDLQGDFGFRIGPWNQSYMFDTLPIVLSEDQMKPGDLVFMTGTYVNPKSKKQRHNMMHVEVWLGDGPKTIGARWNNGKVQVFDSYKFNPKSFTNEQYLFRSIDTWLMGICKSHCEKHRWGTAAFNPSKKSIFYPQQNLSLQDQKAGDDSDTGESQRQADRKVQQGDEKSSGSASAQSGSGTPQRRQTPKKKKRSRKNRKVVSKNSYLPQATRSALLELEDRIDNMVARKTDVFGVARRQCPVRPPRGMKGKALTARPATSATDTATRPVTNGSPLRCPVVGDCNAQPMSYVPALMPKRYGSPMPARRTALPPELQEPRRPRWFDQSPRSGVSTDGGSFVQRGAFTERDGGSRVQRGPLPDRASVLTEGRSAMARGLLTVVGSGQASLKKNKSCTDLEFLSAKYRHCGRGAGGPGASNSGCSNSNGNRAPGSRPWRHSAPENLQDLTSLSFSAQFVQQVRDSARATPATLSVEATCSGSSSSNSSLEEEEEEKEKEEGSLGEDTLDEDEDAYLAAEPDEDVEVDELQEVDEDARSGSDGETSVACWSDCCPSDSEDWSELEEGEDVDTDEELERFRLPGLAWVEEKDSKDDDSLEGALLSLAYKSEWNVHESQSFAGTEGSYPRGPPRAASCLPLRGQRNVLLAPLDPEQRPLQDDPGLGAGNLNNNSGRPKSAYRPPKIRYSPRSSRSMTAVAVRHVRVPLRLGRPSTATGVEASLRLASTSKGAEASLGQASTFKEDEAFLGQASTSKEDRAFLGQASTSKKDRAFLGQASTSKEDEAFLGQASTSKDDGAFLGQASTSKEDRAFLGQASTSKDDEAFLGQASTSKKDVAFLGQASTSQGAEAFVVQASTSRGVEQSTGPLIVVIPAELTSAESVPTGEEVPVVGGSSLGVTSSAPMDGDEKTGGESGGGSGAEPSESEQAGGEEAGGEGTGEGGGGRSGRRGGKKTPGGRPTKLPACSLPANMTPTFYVGGGNGVALVEAPLLALGWKRTMDKYDERYRLKWVECKSKINYNAFKEGDQIVNHIPNCKLLTNKLGLLCSLQEYERVTLSTKGRLPRLKMSDFIPETYKLDERVDRATFLSLYKDGEMWICKPVGLNQGKGIFLLRSREEIDNLLAERDAKKETNKHSTRPPMSRIVQRYIPNPLLLEGRKFDIRAYMLIASTVPYLVLFQHGYIRLSCLKYNGSDTNLTTHLTNQFVQKKDPNYKEVKEDTAWTMEKFNDYINKNYAADKGIEEDWTFNTLTKQMQRIMLHCFNSVKHKLQCKIGYFDLYGLDFMVDTDMKVWLIEINVNPALHVNCEALKEVIPGVVEETLHVSIEAFDKSRRNQPLMPLQSLKKFQILYCGTAPFNVAPRQTRSVSPAKGEYPERARQTQTAHPPSRHHSPPRGLPRMSLSTTQVQVLSSPYATPSQGGNAGGVRTSQTMLPNISHSNSNNQSVSNKTTAPNASTNTSKTTVTIVTSNKSSSGSIPSSGTTTTTTTIMTNRQLASAKETKMSGEDIRLKMTHSSSASSARKSRDKPDRGN